MLFEVPFFAAFDVVFSCFRRRRLFIVFHVVVFSALSTSTLFRRFRRPFFIAFELRSRRLFLPFDIVAFDVVVSSLQTSDSRF